MARPLCSGLTPAHSRVLYTIGRLFRKGFAPSVGEIVTALDLAGDTSLSPTLRIMERNGFVKLYGGGVRGKRRVVTLTARGKAALAIGGLPVVASISAGPLSENLSQAETVLDDAEILPYRPGDFLLVVEGDSMIGDGILPGDKVLLRPNVELRDGEIAAVQWGDDYQATLKHVRFAPGRRKVTLEASNPNFRSLTFSASDVRIAGVYRGLVRVT